MRSLIQSITLPSERYLAALLRGSFIRTPVQTAELRSAIVPEDFRLEMPCDAGFYVFCRRARRTIIVVYWGTNKLSLRQKHLKRDLFPWPRAGDDRSEMTRQNTRPLLHGIEV